MRVPLPLTTKQRMLIKATLDEITAGSPLGLSKREWQTNFALSLGIPASTRSMSREQASELIELMRVFALEQSIPLGDEPSAIVAHPMITPIGEDHGREEESGADT